MKHRLLIAAIFALCTANAKGGHGGGHGGHASRGSHSGHARGGAHLSRAGAPTVGHTAHAGHSSHAHGHHSFLFFGRHHGSFIHPPYRQDSDSTHVR